jgi:hypothetical protein
MYVYNIAAIFGNYIPSLNKSNKSSLYAALQETVITNVTHMHHPCITWKNTVVKIHQPLLLRINLFLLISHDRNRNIFAFSCRITLLSHSQLDIKMSVYMRRQSSHTSRDKFMQFWTHILMFDEYLYIRINFHIPIEKPTVLSKITVHIKGKAIPVTDCEGP